MSREKEMSTANPTERLPAVDSGASTLVDETEGGGWQDMLASRRGVLRGGGSRVEEGGVLEADILLAGRFDMVAAESQYGKER